jgi:hypothetical protein
MVEAAIHVNDRMLELKAELDVLKTQYDTLLAQMDTEMPLQGKDKFECGKHGDFVRKQRKPPLAHGMSKEYLAKCIAAKYRVEPALVEKQMGEWKDSIPRAAQGAFVVQRILPPERRNSKRRAAEPVAAAAPA